MNRGFKREAHTACSSCTVHFGLFEFVAYTSFIFRSYPAMLLLGAKVAKMEQKHIADVCFLQSRFSHVFALSHLCPKWQSAKQYASTVGIRRSSTDLFQGSIQHELTKTWSFGLRTHCDLG